VSSEQPATDPSGASILAGRSNLVLRILSSLVLVPAALAAAYFGGLVFLVFWTGAAAIVFWEWQTLVCDNERNSVLAIGLAALAGAAAALAFGWEGTALAFVVLGAFGVATLASKGCRHWCAAGVFYAAAILIAPVLLRADPSFGFAAIVFVFVVVWSTDIAAYFAGRAIGGPKLMPAVSPNKTWAGAVGGTIAAVAAGVLTARLFGLAGLVGIATVALVLSLASQAGDLLESAIKRRFHTKDASHLIPGHGGLMDRLDGFVAAVFTALLIGLARGGVGAPAHGLVVW
jgi:phosphatidate cytidylyltransferase